MPVKMSQDRGYSSLLILSVALLLGGFAACSPETSEEARQETEEAGEALAAAGEKIGEGLKEGGRVVGEAAQELGEDLEPHARDAAITARVKVRLAADPEVGALGIDVDTVDGRVTLNGKVGSAEEKAEAEELAAETQGVVEVLSLLVIEPEAA